MKSPLLITGASARAAAASAVRAGFDPSAADLFGDEDLRACCPAVRIEPYPQQLVEAARCLPPGPWMYTGGLENHPALVDQLAAERTLLGNRGDVLRRVRDALQLSAALRAAGYRFPATHIRAGEVPPNTNDGVRWLIKPRDSCGGHGISFANPAVRHNAQMESPAVWQEYIAGVPASAVFVAASGKAVLLGFTRQLIGTAWTGACEFGYAGSIGPWPVSAVVRKALRTIGGVLAERFDLVGLFGVDLVLVGDDVWTIEVNPRYTASIEVLERTDALRSIALHSIALHVAACREGVLPAELDFAAKSCAGKAIVYAREPNTIGERFAQLVHRLNRAEPWPQLADLPSPGSTIAAGWPMCTVLAAGASPSAVETRLKELVYEVASD